MTFGEKLLQLRRDGKLSQEDLAEKLGVSRQAVSRWENEGVLPDCRNLLEISRLFGVSTDYLLHDGYQSDRDLPAVRSAETQLEEKQERQGVLLFLAGLHAVFLLLAVGVWAAWQAPFPLTLCAAASLGDILFAEAWLRSGQAPAEELPGLRRRYYRLGVWFFAWFPVVWLSSGLLRLWPWPVSTLTICAITAAVWLAACGLTWQLTKKPAGTAKKPE